MCSICGTCGPALTKFVSWMHLMWMQSNLGMTYFLTSQGGQMYESNFGTTSVAEVLTTVHKDF